MTRLVECIQASMIGYEYDDDPANYERLLREGPTWRA